MRKIFFIFLLIIIITIAACSDKKSQVNILQQNTTAQAPKTIQPSIFDKPFIPDPSTATIEYPDTQIYYENNRIIYSYNPKTKENQELIASGSDVVLSHAKNKFDYVKWERNDKGSHYLYKIDTKESKSLSNHLQFIEWSPNDKYLVSSDMSPMDITNFEVTEVETNKIIADFKALEGNPLWLNNEELIFTEFVGNETQGMMDGYYPLNISILDCDTGEKRILKKAIEYKDTYRLIDIIGDKIYCRKSIAESKKDWQENNIKDIMIIIDKYGNELSSSTDEKISGEKRGETTVYDYYNQVEGKLPFAYKTGELTIVALSTNPNWVILVFSRYGGNTPKGLIFIMDMNNFKSLKQISEGYSAHW